MPEQPDDRRGPGLRLSLIDLSALVVGYGLASLLVRAYWPDNSHPTVLEVATIGLIYAWLGLAMSGPAVLLLRRPAPADPDEPDRPEPRTWAELAWMIIGFYWIGLAVLVVPARMNGGRFLDSAILGIFPVLAGLTLRVLGPKHHWARARPRRNESTWTHGAGVALLVTWPFTWVGLILLGKTLM